MTRWLLAALLALALPGIACADDAAPAAGGGAGYSATVPVADTSDAQRNQAIANALTQVLAQQGAKATPDALAQASGLVRVYRYQRAPGGGLQLQVDFDPGSLQRLIQQQGGQPVAPAAAANAAATGATGAPATAGGSGTLWVGGLDDGQAYADLLATLRDDPDLHNVQPLAARDDGLLLQIDYSAPLADVVKALVANGHLAQAAAHANADAALRWVH